MERFTQSIRKSIESKNWFAALFMSLALPDICGALEDPSRPVGERYKDWFNRYLKKKYNPDNMYEFIQSINPHKLKNMPLIIIESLKKDSLQDKVKFTADDCYRLRCKCLHQGLSERMDQERVHFTIPDPSGKINIHMGKINMEKLGVFYQLSIDKFCLDVCEAVGSWAIDIKSNTVIQSRIEKLIKMYDLDDKELPLVKYSGE